MSDATRLISDLIRAANGVDRNGESEICRLIRAADQTISTMRLAVGIPPSAASRDALIEIYIMSEHLQDFDADHRRAALLEAAGMIRELHIVLETRTAIGVGPRGHV